MIQFFTWLENLYQTKKWLFYVIGVIAFPVLIFYLYTKLSIWFEVSKAKQNLALAKTKDSSIEAKEEPLKKVAEDSLTNAQKTNEQIDNIKVDADWNLKK